MRFLQSLAFAVLTISHSSAVAQVRVGEDRLVSSVGPMWPITEPHLAVNPLNPRHMVATGITVQAVDWAQEFKTSCAVFVTRDGGENWIRHDFDFEECGDPWVTITMNGTAVFTGLGRLPGTQDGLWLIRSEDGGESWTREPTFLGPAFDHQTLVVDESDGTRRGSVYLVGAEPGSRVHVSRSDDHGISFPTHEHVVPSNLSLEAQNPVLLSNGALVVPFTDHQARPRHRLERRRSWVVVSPDGGKTYSAPKFVTESCNRTRPAAWPSLAVDGTDGQYRDRLYWICEEQDFKGVLVHHSPDSGESWSEPIRVGDSGVRNPYTKTPTIAVDGSGDVGLTWYDGRNHTWHACHEMYFSYSRDGGASFTEPEKISSEPSCPFTPHNGDAAWRWPGGGDYIGMVGLPAGFVVVWSDSRDGTYRLRTVTIQIDR